MSGSRFKQSNRMHSVQDPVIPAIAGLIQANPGTISLGQGVANFGPPSAIYEKIDRFQTDNENNKYSQVEGIPQLKEMIAGKLASENGITLNDTSRIIVTAGANMGFLNALFAITDPGDEIILLVPYYFNHEMAVTMLSCNPVLVDTDNMYLPDLEKIERAITPNTRAIVTVSPNNPTGAVYPEKILADINQLCLKHAIYHITDETYEYFTYGDTDHFSPGGLPDSEQHTISLFSLSKAYGFASWRIGYMVIPEHLVMAIKKAQDTNLICPPLISQYAALGALESGREYCQSHLDTILAVRKHLLHELGSLDSRLSIGPADGALYLFIKMHTGMTAIQVVTRLIEDHKIAVIPGNTFGMHQGCFLRVSYGALGRDTAITGVGRLIKGISEILGT